MQIEWSRHVTARGRVLILTPLAVAQQTAEEGAAHLERVAHALGDGGDRVDRQRSCIHRLRFDGQQSRCVE